MTPLLKKILIYVITAHFFVILFSIIEFHFSHHSKPREKVVVHTVALSTPSPTRTQPEPKKEKKVAAKPKKEAVKKKVMATDEKKKSLLQQAKEKIAKIEMNYDTVPSSKKPKTITGLHIDQLSDRDSGYIDEIATVLQSLLRLPEIGDVVVDLKIKRTGSVNQVKITSTASERNKKYVETTLPNVKFPPFEGYFSNEQEHTFHITLSDVK